jgi:hypothetical protein
VITNNIIIFMDMLNTGVGLCCPDCQRRMYLALMGSASEEIEAWIAEFNKLSPEEQREFDVLTIPTNPTNPIRDGNL